MSLLQAHHLLVPDPVGQQVHRPAAQRLVPGMGTAVGDTGVGVGVIQDFRNGFSVSPGSRVEGEFGPQAFVYGQVQHGVHGVLASHLGQLCDGLSLILEVPLVPDFHHPHLGPIGGYVGATTCSCVGTYIPAHFVADSRRVQLGDTICRGADERIDPVGHGVEPVVFSELEHR